MAGATVATWVKVKTKSGLTSRPISHEYEGGSGYEPGQVITMSEYQKLKAEGNQKRDNKKQSAVIASPATEILTTPKKKRSPGRSQKSFMGGLMSAAEDQENAEVNRSTRRQNRAAKKQPSVPTPQNKPSRTPKTSLSKQEKKDILLKNKKELEAHYKDSGQGDQVARLNRVDKAERDRRKSDREVEQILAHGNGMSGFFNSSDIGQKRHRDVANYGARKKKEAKRKAMAEKARKGRQ